MFSFRSHTTIRSTPNAGPGCCAAGRVIGRALDVFDLERTHWLEHADRYLLAPVRRMMIGMLYGMTIKPLIFISIISRPKYVQCASPTASPLRCWARTLDHNFHQRLSHSGGPGKLTTVLPVRPVSSHSRRRLVADQDGGSIQSTAEEVRLDRPLSPAAPRCAASSSSHVVRHPLGCQGVGRSEY